MISVVFCEFWFCSSSACHYRFSGENVEAVFFLWCKPPRSCISMAGEITLCLLKSKAKGGLIAILNRVYVCTKYANKGIECLNHRSSSLVNAQTFVDQIDRRHTFVRRFLFAAETFKFLPDRSLQVATACDNAVLNSDQLEVEIDNN